LLHRFLLLCISWPFGSYLGWEFKQWAEKLSNTNGSGFSLGGLEAPPPLDPVLTLDFRNLFRYRYIVYEKIDIPIFSFLNLKNSEKKVCVGVLVEKIMGGSFFCLFCFFRR